MSENENEKKKTTKKTTTTPKKKVTSKKTSPRKEVLYKNTEKVVKEEPKVEMIKDISPSPLTQVVKTEEVKVEVKKLTFFDKIVNFFKRIDNWF